MISAANYMLLKKASCFPLVVDRDRERMPDDLSFAEIRAISLKLIRFLNFAQITELIRLRCFYLEIVDYMRSDPSLQGDETILAVHDFLIRHFPSGIFPDRRERIVYLHLFRRLKALLGPVPETTDHAHTNDLLQSLSQALSALLEHISGSLGLRVKSEGTNPELWSECVILAGADHPQLHAQAADFYIDLFPFYIYAEKSYLEWRSGDLPLAYCTDTGKIVTLQTPEVRAALLRYHELFLMTSAGRKLLQEEGSHLESGSLESLETMYSHFRAGEHDATIETLNTYRFIQYKRNPKAFEMINFTLDYIEAVCLLNLKKDEQAERSLNRLTRTAAKLFYPYLTLARIQEDSGRMSEAARLKEKLEQIVVSADDGDYESQAQEIRRRRLPLMESTNLPPELIDLKYRVSREPSPIIGRRQEIAEVIEILCCMYRNNAVIVGNPGIGKTALVHEVVRHLNADEVPVQLQQTPVYELNVASLFSGISHRGQLEQKLSHVLSLVERERAILFIDDIHTLLHEAIVRSGTLDISTMLKPALEGKLARIIAATTYEDYAIKITPIPLFTRLFQKIDLAELPLNDIVHIMLIRADEFCRYHQVTIDIEGICRHLDTVRQFFRDRMLPDKAIALLDRVCSRKSVQRGATEAVLPHVSELDFLKIGADSRGVEISTISATLQEKLKELESALNRQIIGQPQVIMKLAKKIVPSRTGLKMKEGRPDGVFLFVGPTGVGKTETARVLTDVLMGSEDKLLRIDMSEYMEEYSVSRLIGAAPGYVGYDDQNQLIDEIRRDPYRIILLDEIEKAHPLLINIFLQVFDSGILTDAKGRKAYFDKSIIIMTSNVGVSLFSEARIGFDPDKKAKTVTRSAHSKEVKRFFRPEFLNRIDEVIFFNPLNLEDARRIVRLHIDRLNDRFRGKGLFIRLSNAAVECLADRGFSEEYGAREILRVIQDLILQPIADLRLTAGSTFRNVSVSYVKSSDKLFFRTN